jgi:hypothetical protein
VIVFFVMVSAIWSPTTMARASESSCARAIVSVLPTRFVTRMISAFERSGCCPATQTVQLKPSPGKDGKIDPSWTTNDRPELAGDGAPVTVV